MADDEHLFVLSYDISDRKRWRRLFKLMHGYGAWLQFSVFQCRMSRRRLAELKAACDEIINHNADHVLILDLGPADRVKPRVESLGRTFDPVPREPIIV